MRILSVLLICVCLVSLLPVALYAQTETLASNAEKLRSQLVDAQLSMSTDIGQAETLLTDARNVYAATIADAVKIISIEMDQNIEAYFASAQEALKNHDAIAFAQLRSQLWTTLLQVAVLGVDSNLVQGDLEAANRWLGVREFRHATRFSRPNADATIALRSLQNGSASLNETRLAVRADLFDTYQARLSEAMRDAIDAEAKNFLARRAELVALAAGYFSILSPAYLEQNGAAAAQQRSDEFQHLVEASRQFQSQSQSPAQPLAPEITTIQTALSDFRAAPLSLSEQMRRSGQLLRFLNLVQVEYSRGVVNGAVKSDLEIREASTFLDGASAAFDDLYTLLSQRDVKLAADAKAVLATLTQQIEGAATGSAVAEIDAVQSNVATLTTQLQSIMPVEWLKRDNSADFDVIQASLDNMEAAIAKGDYELAESARLDAYAILESGPEARIQAFAAQFKTPIEEMFWFGRGDAKGLAFLIQQKAPLAEVKSSRNVLDGLLSNAQQVISGKNSPTATATNAAIIVFREGLEAVLILASLMGSMKAATSRQLRKPIWWGVVGAIIASGLTWLLAQGVLASLSRYGEKLEAIVSLIAIAVLLLITNWFFHQTYWTDHMANLHTKKRGLLGGNAGQWLGLAVLGFTSVYREGFETVLFLQALVLESGTWIVLLGTLIGLLATMLIGLVLFRLQVRLPYKKMLIVTGIFIGVVLLTMVGNTTHILQVVGWLPLHPIRWLNLPYWFGMWFGIYASWEGLALQFVAGTFVLGSYFLAEYFQKHTHRQRTQRQSTSIHTANL